MDCVASNTLLWNFPSCYWQLFDLVAAIVAECEPGINVCAPVNGSTIHLPLDLQATAKITGSPARIECRIDGKKEVVSLASSVMDVTFCATNVCPGKHRFDFIAINTAGRQQTVYATLGQAVAEVVANWKATPCGVAFFIAVGQALF